MIEENLQTYELEPIWKPYEGKGLIINVKSGARIYAYRGTLLSFLPPNQVLFKDFKQQRLVLLCQNIQILDSWPEGDKQ